jgi:hypothetical protein
VTHKLCYEGWAMKDGNSSGRCCCNCKYQKPAVGHPWNTRQWLKKSISTMVAYACTVPDMERIVLFDKEHGMCEMHDWREL